MLWIPPLISSTRPPAPTQVDLPTQLCLDLVHCERAAEAVVAASGGAITQAQGELFSTAYFDGLAAEVDEALQEAGVAAGAAPAAAAAMRGNAGGGASCLCGMLGWGPPAQQTACCICVR